VTSSILHSHLQGFGHRHTRGHRAARIVVIGNVGNGNTGDEALLAVTVAALDRAATVTVLSRHPAQVTALHGVSAAPMTVRGAAPVLARCDGIVVVGGGMFGPGLPPLVRLLPHLVHAAALAGRDTAYVGIGVHRGMPAGTLSALRRSVRRSRSATVRDRASGRLLDPVRPAACIGDLALYLQPASAEEARAALHTAGVDLTRPLLLLAPKAGTSPDKTRRMLAASSIAARHWHSRGGVVAALALADHADHGLDPTHTDTALAERIARDAAVTIPRLGPNLHPALAKAVTAQAAALLGLRFHGVVFATAAGVPATSFAWEPKTAALLSDRALPVINNPIQPHQITGWLDSCLPAHTAVTGIGAETMRSTS
jgi:polysaccharide pyruvyl transferase WcaK-like protein